MGSVRPSGCLALSKQERGKAAVKLPVLLSAQLEAGLHRPGSSRVKRCRGKTPAASTHSSGRAGGPVSSRSPVAHWARSPAGQWITDETRRYEVAYSP